MNRSSVTWKGCGAAVGHTGLSRLTRHTGLLPVHAQHQAVDSGADAEERQILGWLDVPAFEPNGHGDRQGHRAGIPEPL